MENNEERKDEDEGENKKMRPPAERNIQSNQLTISHEGGLHPAQIVSFPFSFSIDANNTQCSIEFDVGQQQQRTSIISLCLGI